jgi:hypothetical protein
MYDQVGQGVVGWALPFNFFFERFFSQLVGCKLNMSLSSSKTYWNRAKSDRENNTTNCKLNWNLLLHLPPGWCKFRICLYSHTLRRLFSLSYATKAWYASSSKPRSILLSNLSVPWLQPRALFYSLYSNCRMWWWWRGVAQCREPCCYLWEHALLAAHRWACQNMICSYWYLQVCHQRLSN